jgi:hypothetical protein
MKSYLVKFPDDLWHNIMLEHKYRNKRKRVPWCVTIRAMLCEGIERSSAPKKEEFKKLPSKSVCDYSPYEFQQKEREPRGFAFGIASYWGAKKHQEYLFVFEKEGEAPFAAVAHRENYAIRVLNKERIQNPTKDREDPHGFVTTVKILRRQRRRWRRVAIRYGREQLFTFPDVPSPAKDGQPFRCIADTHEHAFMVLQSEVEKFDKNAKVVEEDVLGRDWFHEFGYLL